MATLESRIKALEGKDEGIEILNPRWWLGESDLTEEEHERQNAERRTHPSG